MIIKAIQEAQKRLINDPHDIYHDINHHYKVWENCLQIADTEKLKPDLKVLEISAWWHDVYYDKDRLKKLKSTFSRMGLKTNLATQVVKTINEHSFGKKQTSIESKILYDADKIEYVSISRWKYASRAFQDSLISEKERDKHIPKWNKITPRLSKNLHFKTSNDIFERELKSFVALLKKTNRWENNKFISETQKDKRLAKQVLESYKKVVWPEIKKYLKDPVFPRQFRVPSKHKSLEKYHWKIAREYPQRKGKYLRPTLVMLVNAAMGGKNKHALKTAAAMQTSEEWILIHDDVEDDSELRRGKPCLHKRYGVELAVNVGDTLHAVMWKMLIDNHKILGKEKSIKLMNEFHKIILRTTLGQTADIKWIKENKPNTTNSDWYFIADSKSSYYSISAPLRLGAMLADANDKQLNALADFGVQLGRGWQLTDDLLDVTSDFSGLKQKGNDIYEGKRTILLAHLLRKAGPTERAKILRIIGKPRKEMKNKEVDWIIKMMNDYGSVDYANKLADQFRKRALQIFDADLLFLSKQPYRDNLKSLIHFIFDRNH